MGTTQQAKTPRALLAVIEVLLLVVSKRSETSAGGVVW